MTRLFGSVFLPVFFLAACGGGSNPFDQDEDVTVQSGGDTETLETADPTTVNSLFAFAAEEGLTLNDVEYDPENDELVVNNLPFDGPEGRYDLVRQNGDTRIFQSRRTPTTGQIDHYAVFIPGDEVRAAAALGDWGDFGYGGANVKRDSYELPSGVGEYVYLGTYAGLRNKDDRAGIELVQGNARLLLDVLDLDPDGNIQGSIIGQVTGRTRTATGGAARADLPPLVLKRVSFDNQTGTFTGGTAVTRSPRDGSDFDTGEYQGFIGGPNGNEMAASVVIEGPGELQEVFYEEIEWTNTEEVEIEIGDTGLTVTEERTTSGTISGLNADNREAIQAQVDQGIQLGVLGADRSELPDTAVIESSETKSTFITGDGQAREIGVIATDVVETP